jgi:hypothetical protein
LVGPIRTAVIGRPACLLRHASSPPTATCGWLEAQGADKYHLMTEDDRLTFLADGSRAAANRAAVSIGDVFIYAGPFG